MRLKAIISIAVVALIVSVSASAQYGYDSDCEDAKSAAESAANDLADYARRLQQCADYEAFSNDCSLEFQHVRSAYDDYESAVSDVDSYCE